MSRRLAAAGGLALGAGLLAPHAAAAPSAPQCPTARVSVATDGSQASGRSLSATISADGRFVAFESDAADLVPTDTNGKRDVFVRDRFSGTTVRVSVGSSGAQGNGDSKNGAISANGRFVAFESDASNLDPRDRNGTRDVFLHDRTAGTTELVSFGARGQEADGPSFAPSVSEDGRVVAFLSQARNLVPVNVFFGVDSVYARDRRAGTNTLVSVTWTGTPVYGDLFRPIVTADGRSVMFSGDGNDIVPDDPNTGPFTYDVYVRDLAAGETEKVSTSSSGSPAIGSSVGWSISRDGRFVGFQSVASNLVPGDVNGQEDVFVKDRLSGQTTLASLTASGEQGDSSSIGGWLSPDGRLVAFHSPSRNFSPPDLNNRSDVFVRDLASGELVRASVSSLGVGGDLDSLSCGVAAGGVVLMVSAARNLVPGDTNATWDVFVHDLGKPTPSGYCTAKTNSLGCLPFLAVEGTPSLSSGEPYRISAFLVVEATVGMLLYGSAPSAVPFEGGTLCVAAPRRRTGPQHSGGWVPCDGSVALDFNAYVRSGFDPALVPCTAVYAQYWYRDPGDPGGTGLTGGWRFTIQP